MTHTQKKQTKAAQPETVLKLNLTTARKIFSALMPCISREETRYYLNGVCVQNYPGRPADLMFIATDGHRMGLFEHFYNQEQNEEAPTVPDNTIIPTLAALYLSKLKTQRNFNDKDQTVTLRMTGGKLVIEKRLGDILEESKHFGLIDGNYPSWERVCPTDRDLGENVGTFNADYISELAKAASNATESKGVPIAVGNSYGGRSPAWIIPDVVGLRYVLMPKTAGDYLKSFAPDITESERWKGLATQIRSTPGGDYETKEKAAEMLDLLAKGESMADVVNLRESA